MDDKWIDSIRDRMADYEAVPPAGLLEAVEAHVRGVKMRRRRILSAIAASVVLIGGITVALMTYRPDTAPEPLMAYGSAEKVGMEKTEEFIVQIADNSADSPLISTKSKTVVAVQSGNIGALVSESTAVGEGMDTTDQPKVHDVETPSGSEPYTASDLSDTKPHTETASAIQSKDPHSDAHAPAYLGISTSANGLGGVFGGDGLESRTLMASATTPHTRMGGGLLGEVYYANSGNMPAFVDVFDHRLPVRASVDFSWPLGYSLSIGTGLTYSYLRSDIRYGYSDSPLFKASQSLHFLGIPVNVRYTPWSFKRFDVYASAGIMAEKCIRGRIKRENPEDPEYSYAGCDDRPFQFSVNAAAGLQYSLAGSCAVFIEPGIALYLKNGSLLRTIYSERPLTFNVNIGLRFRR